MNQLSIAMRLHLLTPEEHAEKGRELAEALMELLRVQNDHKERRAYMKQEQEDIEARIAHLRDICASGQEERPVA